MGKPNKAVITKKLSKREIRIWKTILGMQAKELAKLK